jgi:hypothetical protein
LLRGTLDGIDDNVSQSTPYLGCEPNETMNINCRSPFFRALEKPDSRSYIRIRATVNGPG